MRCLYQRQQPVTISIAVKCGDQWAHYESKGHRVLTETGKRLPLISANKALNQKPATKHSVAVGDLGQVRELQLQVHNGKNDVAVLFNQLGFQEKQADKLLQRRGIDRSESNRHQFF